MKFLYSSVKRYIGHQSTNTYILLLSYMSFIILIGLPNHELLAIGHKLGSSLILHTIKKAIKIEYIR